MVFLEEFGDFSPRWNWRYLMRFVMSVWCFFTLLFILGHGGAALGGGACKGTG